MCLDGHLAMSSFRAAADERQVPTGGEKAVAEVGIRMMPKWMSDSPSWRTTGSWIGVKIEWRGVMSLNTRPPAAAR